MTTPRFDRIPDEERSFRRTGVFGGYRCRLTPVTLVSRDNSAEIDVVRCRPADGRTDYFGHRSIPKARICLHATLGALRGDILTLTNASKGRLSVAFVVARDGTIYELFESDKWAYHLGPSKHYRNTDMSAVSVGIELSNFGPLKRAGHRLLAYDSTYCTIDQTDAYVELDEPFRGHRYFASHTEAQLQATIRLVDYLCAEHQIPPVLLPENQRYELLSDLRRTGVGTRFMGICSHVNFREDKTDLGPAFDWAALEAGLAGPMSFGMEPALPSIEDRMTGLDFGDEAGAPDAVIDPHDRGDFDWDESPDDHGSPPRSE